jgi:hypothetical protein
MAEDNIFMAIAAVICMYVSYIILVVVAIDFMRALNFRRVFRGLFQILLHEMYVF